MWNADTYALQDLLVIKAQTPTPKQVVLCGSTRFYQAFQEANLRETLVGNIVLSIGCDTKADRDLSLGSVDKMALDVLHLYKIDLADEVLVLNVGGYIGASTRREVKYAYQLDKLIRVLVTDVCSICGTAYDNLVWLYGQSSCAPCGCDRCFLRPALVLPDGSVCRSS